jgi:hypothetical protein
LSTSPASVKGTTAFLLDIAEASTSVDVESNAAAASMAKRALEMEADAEMPPTKQLKAIAPVMVAFSQLIEGAAAEHVDLNSITIHLKLSVFILLVCFMQRSR